ncbi:MAG: L-histidine N(alpha)-methyltransferase [Candidatus Eremiobacteraeota bacterium]|nr:L-histidine N(alpha)-methyltransferase [Candidatus Eremiobacteraeota bacterium]
MRMSATSPSGERLEIVTLEAPKETKTGFADDVRAGLNAQPRSLPAKYHYDELGSTLFDAITTLPEYYLTRAETEVLRQWGWEMVRALGNPIEFLELGSGSAVKTRLLIEEALRVQRTLRYMPIDISPEALRASAGALVAAYPGIRVSAYAADYFSLLRERALRRENRVFAMIMGSNIGNYEPKVARELLSLLSRALRPNDGLLLGADLKKDPRILELAYNDPTGVTAAFNLNLLGRINRELGGDFDIRAFKHVARYDETRGSVDSHLVAKSKQIVSIRKLGQTFEFAEGDGIHTESSYKFTVEDLRAIAQETGFTLSRTWMDKAKRFAVNLLVRK